MTGGTFNGASGSEPPERAPLFKTFSAGLMNITASFLSRDPSSKKTLSRGRRSSNGTAVSDSLHNNEASARGDAASQDASHRLDRSRASIRDMTQPMGSSLATGQRERSGSVAKKNEKSVISRQERIRMKEEAAMNFDEYSVRKGGAAGPGKVQFKDYSAYYSGTQTTTIHEHDDSHHPTLNSSEQPAKATGNPEMSTDGDLVSPHYAPRVKVNVSAERPASPSLHPHPHPHLHHHHHHPHDKPSLHLYARRFVDYMFRPTRQGVFHPKARACRLWTLLRVLAVFVFLFIAPFEAAFTHRGFQDVNTLQVLQIVCEVFYVLDIAQQMNVGYIRESAVILDRSLIVHRYVNTRLLWDAIASIPIFWEIPGVRSGVPWIRLLHCVKLVNIREEVLLFTRISADHIGAAVTLMTLLILWFMGIVHALACIWFVVMTRQHCKDGSPGLFCSWIYMQDDLQQIVVHWQEGMHTRLEESIEMYMACMYWAAGAANTYEAHTSTERVTATTAHVIISLVFGAFIIANALQVLTEFTSNSAWGSSILYHRKVDGINDYMGRYRFPDKLRSDIRRFYRNAWLRQQVDLSDQMLLEDLPQHLRMRVLKHMAKSLLSSSDFFTDFIEVNDDGDSDDSDDDDATEPGSPTPPGPAATLWRKSVKVIAGEEATKPFSRTFSRAASRKIALASEDTTKPLHRTFSRAASRKIALASEDTTKPFHRTFSRAASRKIALASEDTTKPFHKTFSRAASCKIEAAQAHCAGVPTGEPLAEGMCTDGGETDRGSSPFHRAKSRKFRLVPPVTHEEKEDWIEALAGKLYPVTFAPGEFIFQEGDMDDLSMFIIKSGRVSFWIHGKEVSSLGSGSYFGEVAMVSGEPRMATARSVMYTETFKLDKESMEEIWLRFPRLRQLNFETAYARFRDLLARADDEESPHLASHLGTQIRERWRAGQANYTRDFEQVQAQRARRKSVSSAFPLTGADTVEPPKSSYASMQGSGTGGVLMPDASVHAGQVFYAAPASVPISDGQRLATGIAAVKGGPGGGGVPSVTATTAEAPERRQSPTPTVGRALSPPLTTLRHGSPAPTASAAAALADHASEERDTVPDLLSNAPHFHRPDAASTLPHGPLHVAPLRVGSPSPLNPRRSSGESDRERSRDRELVDPYGIEDERDFCLITERPTTVSTRIPGFGGNSKSLQSQRQIYETLRRQRAQEAAAMRTLNAQAQHGPTHISRLHAPSRRVNLEEQYPFSEALDFAI